MINIFGKTDNKGKIEGKVMDLFAEAASGQLTVFKPEEEGVVDLIAKKRGEYQGGAEIGLNIRECTKDDSGELFIDQIKEGEIPIDPSLYIIFLHFDIVSQDISEYLWLFPTDKFFEMAEIVQSKDKKKAFKFSAPIDVKKESNYKRYLIPKKELPRLVVKIIEDGGKFIFPTAGFSGVVNFKTEDLKQFIIEARRSTYAGGGAAVDNPRLRGSKEFGYQRGDWFYQDIYFSGRASLIGQEVVYYNAKPVWAMSYFGDQLQEKPTEFLKYVLYNSAQDCRLGGAFEFKKKDFLYQDKGEGTLDKFKGEEKISLDEKETYKLNYQGGTIFK